MAYQDNRPYVPPNVIESNVNQFSGDILLTCTYSPQISPEDFEKLAVGRSAFSFSAELTHLDILGLKICTIFRLDRVTSLTTLTKDGSPHSMQIPLMVQEAAENVGFPKDKIRYYCLEGGELYEFGDLTVRKARHYSDIEALMSHAKLAKVTEILRSENGCPNDRKETYESVIDHLHEEVGEVAEALQKNDSDNFVEELGDVLFNIYLMAQIGRETGAFTINDVIDRVATKMIDKHPDVFTSDLKFKY